MICPKQSCIEGEDSRCCKMTYFVVPLSLRVARGAINHEMEAFRIFQRCRIKHCESFMDANRGIGNSSRLVQTKAFGNYHRCNQKHSESMMDEKSSIRYPSWLKTEAFRVYHRLRSSILNPSWMQQTQAFKLYHRRNQKYSKSFIGGCRHTHSESITDAINYFFYSLPYK